MRVVFEGGGVKFTERQKAIHAARVYLIQSRATKFRGWSFRLLDMAAKARRECMTGQGKLL